MNALATISRKSHTHQNALALPAPQKAEEPGPTAPKDTFQNLPSVWQDIDTQPVKLPKSAPPALPRPVVFLHGFNGSAERWDKVFEWLTSGEEPVNKSGGIVDAGQFENLDSTANLFSLKLSRPYNSVEQNKAELKEAVEAVLQATGAEEVDLVVHSLGGLNARHYLQDDDEKVNKLVMLGTPNHGSQLANLEMYFRKKFGYPILPPVDDDEVRRVLNQLSVDKLDRKDQPKNPWLRALNDDWEQQRDAADVMIVAGAGIPTVTGTPGLTIFGDGVVTRRSAKLSGVKRKTSWFRTHGGLQNSSKVMETTANFLADEKLPEGEHLFDEPTDAVRAAELIMAERSAPQKELTKASPEEAAKASKLPILDPAFQMGLALGVLSAAMGGPKQTMPVVDVDVSSLSESSQIEAEYSIDLHREQNQLQGSGWVDGSPFAEVADFEEGEVHWKSAIAFQSSGVTLEVGEDENSVLMYGELDGVPTDLKMNLQFDEEGNMSGIKTEGTFNLEPYSMHSLINMEELLKGDSPHHHGEMHVNGLVTGETTERSYHVDVHKNSEGIEFNAQADGNHPQEQSIGVTVNVRDRDA